MNINLGKHQRKAINELASGSILCGGVGTGKSRTAIAYYFLKECGGEIKINGKGDFKEMKKPKDLYIITTAKKRDNLEWEGECAPFCISTKREYSINKVRVFIDSWNNIKKYINVKDAFFIFDEQRLVGSGTWVKSFLKIVKQNRWILLSATPGDTWTDYIPVFIANRFYKNRTEFLRRHAVYSRFTKYPKIEKFIEESHLIRLRDSITVVMEYKRETIPHDKIITVDYDKEMFNQITTKRWNPYTNKPVKTISELCYVMRKVVNSDLSRIEAVKKIIKDHPKVIIFYNFDYELEMLRELGKSLGLKTNEWNGHNHQEVPDGRSWLYLVQYTAGAEGWNCIKTDTIIFFSQNYSYKIMIQAAGRINRLNSPFIDLYYFHIRSSSIIDISIAKALKKKKDFNIRKFMDEGGNGDGWIRS
jgi:hypothetical protein